jgi:hypothetical protein
MDGKDEIRMSCFIFGRSTPKLGYESHDGANGRGHPMLLIGLVLIGLVVLWAAVAFVVVCVCMDAARADRAAVRTAQKARSASSYQLLAHR